MKSLLSRRGSLLDNAPSSLLVRQKASNAIPFTAPDNRADEPSVDRELDGAWTATPVTPLRPAAAAQPHSAKQALQAAQIAEVEWLVQQAALSTFRAFQSFAYSASLLFHPRELSYYAVLYHEGDVWRVLKANDIDAAEPAFRHFVEQAMRLADAEMQRAHIEAQTEHSSRLIADSEAQIERARIELQRGAAQDQRVALKQQEVRKELAQLEARRIASQAQLNKLQRQLHQLKATANENVPHLPATR